MFLFAPSSIVISWMFFAVAVAIAAAAVPMLYCCARKVI
jgi:hypothetical protein